MKKILLVCLTLVCTFTNHSVSLAASILAGKNIEDIYVTVTAGSSILGKVFQEISKQNDWTIITSESISTQRVSRTYKSENLKYFVDRELSNKNIILEIDNDNRLLKILSFGHKNDIITYSENSNIFLPPPSKEELFALENLRQEEEKIFLEYLNNQNSVEPVTKIPLIELSSIRKHEQKYVYNHSKHTIIDPASGLSNEELTRRNENEISLLNELIANSDLSYPASVFPDSNLNDIRKSEENVFKQMKSGDFSSYNSVNILPKQ